jgi:hypothetical protein
MELRVEGVRELSRSLRAVDKDLPKRLAEIHKAIGQPLAEDARARAPRQSGRLADSVRSGGSQRVAYVAAGKAKVPYAGPIHFGWPAHNIAPNTFLVDALEAGAERVVDDYLSELERFLDSVWETIPQRK